MMIAIYDCHIETDLGGKVRPDDDPEDVVGFSHQGPML
jgi:hypothetical protein